MFKFLIEGKTIADLKANVVEFFNEFEALQPSKTTEAPQDFLTKIAAKPPEVPKVEATPAPVVIPKTENTSLVTNDYGVDSHGLPWDERIHAVTQGKNKDGSWRYRRGVEDSQIKQVESELVMKARAMQEAQMVSLPPTPQPAPVVQPPIPSVSVPSPVIAPTIPPAATVAPPPMPAPQPTVPSAHTLKTFKETLVPTLAKLVKDGKLTQEYINQLCAHFGVDLIFKVNDQHLEEMFNSFVEYGMIVKAE